MSDDLVREFEELDEKLPFLARVLINRRIDFRQLEEEEPDEDVMRSIIAILRENLECFSEMTMDEIDATLNLVNMACEAMCLVNQGICEEPTPGHYMLTEMGRKCFDDSGIEAEEDTPCSDF